MEPTKEMIHNVMLGTGMDYIQARNHLKSRAILMEMNKINSGLRMRTLGQQAHDAAALAQQVIAKAARSVC